MVQEAIDHMLEAGRENGNGTGTLTLHICLSNDASKS
jgi:hypothetical protein